MTGVLIAATAGLLAIGLLAMMVRSRHVPDTPDAGHRSAIADLRHNQTNLEIIRRQQERLQARARDASTARARDAVGRRHVLDEELRVETRRKRTGHDAD